jgi:hypothetical protein
MHATLIRRSLGGLVPPKVATPRLVVRLQAGTKGYSTVTDKNMFIFKM